METLMKLPKHKILEEHATHYKGLVSGKDHTMMLNARSGFPATGSSVEKVVKPKMNYPSGIN
jgi:fructose 1,6-bisphosphatase